MGVQVKPLENRIRDVSLEAYSDDSNRSGYKMKGCINMAIVAEGVTAPNGVGDPSAGFHTPSRAFTHSLASLQLYEEIESSSDDSYQLRIGDK